MTLLRDWRDGDEIEQVLLVREVERRQKRDGSPFLRVTLADRSGVVPGVLWSAADLEAGAPTRVSGRVAEHPRYGRQLTIESLDRPEPGEVPWDELLVAPARPAADLVAELDAVLTSIADPHLGALLDRLLGSESASGPQYRLQPAAKRNHHAYVHGLLEHSLQVARMVDCASLTFEGIDRDLAVAGALLHDFGKLEAYCVDGGVADLTDEGKLEGEIPLGYYRVRRETEDIADFPPERARALLHIILAHHGRLEHGSPVTPCTREAALVHAMDAVSGQLGSFDRVRNATAPGQRWSSYDRVLETSVLVE